MNRVRTSSEAVIVGAAPGLVAGQTAALEQPITRRSVIAGLLGLGAAAVVGRAASAQGQPPFYLITQFDLKLRAQPSISANVLLVMPAGSRVRGTDQIANGFRQVVYNGTTGWAHEAYMKPETGGPSPYYLTATTGLNLRAEPSASGKILLVIPAGAKVRATDEIVNGYRRVVYNGTTGWAANAYLKA